MRLVVVLPGLSLVGLLVCSCGAGSAASQLAKAPDYNPRDQTKCGVEKSQAKPLIVEWPSADRGELETQAHEHGLVVVRYQGCEMQVLDGCTVAVKYGYAPMTRKKDRVAMRDADDLYANVPVGAARLEAKLEKSGELDVDMTMVGRWEAERRTVRLDELQGSCDGATHVVSALTVGAFTFTAGADATVSGGATVMGAGGGAESNSKREMLNADGDESACEKASATDATPPYGCGALLRVEVVPIVGASRPTTIGSAAAGVLPANAIIDVQGALTTCRDGQVVKAALKAEFDSKQKDLNDRQAVLKKTHDDLEAQRANLTPDDYNRRTQQYQQALAELQQIFARYNSELADHQKKETDPIFNRLVKEVVPALATTRGISVIYDKGAPIAGHLANDDIVFVRTGVDGPSDAERGKPRIDLTTDAIRGLDAH